MPNHFSLLRTRIFIVTLAAFSALMSLTSSGVFAQDACTKAWDEANASSQEAETAFKASKFAEAEELFKTATGRWLVASQQCKDKNSEIAKSNSDVAKESAAIAKKNIGNQGCVAAEQAASGKFKEAIALFEKKQWQEAADGFATVSGMFNKVAADCPGPVGDVAKQNAEVVSRNQAAALTNLKNAKIASTTAVVTSKCEADVSQANALGQNFSTAEKTRDFTAMSNVANELDVIYKKIRTECADNDKAKVEFDERIKALVDVKKQIPACGDAYKAVMSTRDKLKGYAVQAGGGFNDVVRVYRGDVRKAQNVCFGTIFDANDTANDSEADLLEDERSCLPALRRISAKAAGAPGSANCKSRVFIEVEKAAKAK
jgi:hypothetical protein